MEDLTLIELLILTVLICTLATLLSYSYGTGDQLSELPIILRAADSFYLTNDFYTNWSEEFGPRFYFARAIALISSVTPLPTTYFCLTLCCNVLIGAITSLFGHDLFDGSNLAGILATCFVMSIETFNLGYTGHIYAEHLTTSHMVVPFVLAAVWAGIRSRPTLCAILGGIGSLIHPTFGLEIGAISLFIVVMVKLCEKKGCSVISTVTPLRLLVSLLIFGIFAAITIIPYSRQERIPSALFINIEAYFRHPHHDVPSTFGKFEYFRAACFLLATGVAWYWWQNRSQKRNPAGIAIALLVGFLLLLCVGGYVFVEVVPLRSWVLARPFRLLLVIKWLGLVLSAGAVSVYFQADSGGENRLDGYVLAVSVLSPITMGMVHLSMLIRDRAKGFVPVFNVFVTTGPVLLLILGYLLLVKRPADRAVFSFLLFVFMVLPFMKIADRWIARIGTTGAAVLVIALMWWGDVILPSRINDLLPTRPNITLAGLRGAKVEIAAWAKENTPESSVFLGPPDFGLLRLAGNRAVVVDFKAFPFQEQAMVEWQKRLFDCYGQPNLSGFAAANEMDRNYRGIDDLKLYALVKKYGISHVILYHETPTEYPIVFENQEYKVALITDD